MAIYFIVCDAFVKIGHATDPLRRFHQMCIGNPYPMRLLGWTDGGAAEESAMHAKLIDFRHRGEWFHLTHGVLTFVEQQITERPTNGRLRKRRDTPTAFARHLRAARDAASMTQADVAAKSGIALASVYRYERGAHPSRRAVRKLRTIFPSLIVE